MVRPISDGDDEDWQRRARAKSCDGVMPERLQHGDDQRAAPP